MNESGISLRDLDWWLDFAATREWTFARTYAETAPHDYIVAGRTPQMALDDAVRAARVIHTFGSPGKYYSQTKIYLVSPDGRYRWWTEDRHFTDATLVNRAMTDRLYGIQNAYSTASGCVTAFDELATFWDAAHPARAGESREIGELLRAFVGKYPPHVLDIGGGTGRVLDLGLVKPDRYAALDSSQAMLNVLLRKHPRVAAVYPMDVRDALGARLFTPGQFDWVFLDGSVVLSAEQQAHVASLARTALITVDGEHWVARDSVFGQ
jgi:hypothetical protein